MVEVSVCKISALRTNERVGVTVFLYSKIHDKQLFEGDVANYSTKSNNGCHVSNI